MVYLELIGLADVAPLPDGFLSVNRRGGGARLAEDGRAGDNKVRPCHPGRYESARGSGRAQGGHHRRSAAGGGVLELSPDIKIERRRAGGDTVKAKAVDRFRECADFGG
jgi:hypothetical protein